MDGIKILWADDEIDLLRAHVMFLEQKGYIVKTATNGLDAIDFVKNEPFDIIFLDENMPGLTGIETLDKIKRFNSAIPVVMITKSEAEDIMEDAIGSNISDYLIKPVNPNQILLTIKKNVDNKRIITEKTTQAYQTAFGRLGMEISDSLDFNDWKDVYKKLIYWELKLKSSDEKTMDDVLNMQKKEANNSFAKFIKNNYIDWFHENSDNRPVMSHTLFKERIFPFLEKGEKVFVMLFDNLRYDQWKTLLPYFNEYYNIDEEDITCSILPTATQYSRNAMFAGLMPSEIDKLYPDIWLNDEEEGNKNEHEKDLLLKQLKRNGLEKSVYYDKIFNNKQGLKLLDNIKQVLMYDFVTVVFNFIDIMSHARTEMKMIRDDHGTVRVLNPIKVIGDKNTTTNLRYKHGKSLSYKEKEVFEIKKPEQAYLPKSNMTSRYIFSLNDDFFAYPNNFNYYVKYYKNTFQHGGVSLEEMMLPFVVLSPK